MLTNLQLMVWIRSNVLPRVLSPLLPVQSRWGSVGQHCLGPCSFHRPGELAPPAKRTTRGPMVWHQRYLVRVSHIRSRWNSCAHVHRMVLRFQPGPEHGHSCWQDWPTAAKMDEGLSTLNPKPSHCRPIGVSSNSIETFHRELVPMIIFHWFFSTSWHGK